MQPTPFEVDSLKRSWDGTWDLETTEGFEALREELLAYRVEKERGWREKREKTLSLKAEALGCSGNLRLAAYIETLEERIKKLEESSEY